MENQEEIRFHCFPIAGGIASGILFSVEAPEKGPPPKFPIKLSDVATEIHRYREAITSSKEELLALEKALEADGAVDAGSVIAAHIGILDDPLLTTTIEEKIGSMLQNTESVFRSVMGDYEESLSESKNPLFRERLSDMRDLSNRILKHLSLKKDRCSIPLPKQSILVIEDLEPSVAAEGCLAGAVGFISAYGSTASHTAVITKSRSLPYVSTSEFFSIRKYHMAEAIIDGELGHLILFPKEETKKFYQRLLQERENQRSRILESIRPKLQTRDNIPIAVYANIDGPGDIGPVRKFQMDGVGLFRTEFLLLNDPSLAFSWQRQSAIYRQMKFEMEGKVINYRLFDLGEDKNFLSENIHNGYGFRSVRYLFANEDILLNQITALLAAHHGDHLRILIPFVSDPHEIRRVREMISSIQIEHSFSVSVELGAMIETPGAVISIDAIAEEADFISIGTNDLTQFVTSIRRDSQHYNPFHPALFKMIHYVAKKAQAWEKRVSICGEMASDPLFTVLLIGLGIREFSCSPALSIDVKHHIQKLTIAESRAFAELILELRKTEEVKEALLQQEFLNSYSK